MNKPTLFTALFLGVLSNPLAYAAGMPDAAYTAALTLSGKNSVGTTDQATLTLTNSGSVPARSELTIDMPSGFSATNLSSACGGSLSVAETANKLHLKGVSVPARGSCSFKFIVNLPPVGKLPPHDQRTFSIKATEGPGLATLTSSSAPTNILILGSAPGLYSDMHFPAGTKSLSQLDMFITPQTDPGPDSQVFWSNQLLGGYTGMKSTQVADAKEGYGKQFVFQIWGAKEAQNGTTASAGIGGGSYCTVSNTIADGSPGAQCRYYYEWQAGHTYRFRVTPDTALGAGWYKSNVTDTTPGAKGVSFDIGSINVGNGRTDIPLRSITSMFVEYIDWNDERTSCTSIPYSEARRSAQAVDRLGNTVKLLAPSVSTNPTCDNFKVSQKNGEATMIGGPDQSASGLFKTDGRCLTPERVLKDGSSAKPNYINLGTCPTLATVEESGGEHFKKFFWVQAADDTIETKYSYCLTAPSTTQGSQATLATCVENAPGQQWNVVKTSEEQATSQLVAKNSGLCLTKGPEDTLTLESCTNIDTTWTTPGKSFSY